ncbi:MAG: type II CRISPR RNA-guided endonuclease Cas9 [Atopobiaceae bacterium]|nr:type II CRISPR RNA-guided endonuclease Cas9 [Atopobiaceae bacterium]
MSEHTHGKTVLGIDAGIASVGFCLLDLDNHQILELGSRLFDQPIESKTNQNLSVARRQARGQRRLIARRKVRKGRCLGILKNCGLVPAGVDAGWLQSRKGDKNPLALRAEGLDRRLSDRELAQVLYLLCTHRGYIPHNADKTKTGDAAKDKELGKVLSAVSMNRERLAAKGYRTVGEMLAKEGKDDDVAAHRQGSYRNRRYKDANGREQSDYSHTVYMAELVDEVKQLISAQRAFGNDKLTDSFLETYIANMTAERGCREKDAKVYEEQVGYCTYFSQEKRAASATLSNERANAYERFSNLRIINPDGSESRLDGIQIEQFINAIFSTRAPKLTYSKMRKALDLSSEHYFKGVDQDKEGRLEPCTPKAWRAVCKSLSEKTLGRKSVLLTKMTIDRAFADTILEAFAYASDDDSFISRVNELLTNEGYDQLTDDEMSEATSVPFTSRVFKGYCSRSLKALGLLLDCWEEQEITSLTEAEEASGLDKLRFSDRHERSSLLQPYDTYDPTCRNPVVLRSLSQMRRVINAIIKIHGVPDEIHVELSSDLKNSKVVRERIERRKKQRENEKATLRRTIASLLQCEPDDVTEGQLLRYELRQEQDDRDIYSGDQINLMRMLTDQTYAQIDHILPYSRTAIDSRSNKVLVLASSNAAKGERTPLEWMEQDSNAPDIDDYKKRVYALNLPSAKKEKLLRRELSDDDAKQFLNRNLNDNRYLSRSLMNWLADTLAFADSDRRHVYAVTGAGTAILRRSWGLNFGANGLKDRNDDRHHAIDAAVIAACSVSTIQAIATAHARSRRISENRMASTQPWPSFAVELVQRIDHVIPTHQVQKKGTGTVLQATIYSLRGMTSTNKYRVVAGGKEYTSGNIHIHQDGKSVQNIGGMAFLRLWHDADSGKWYPEPVYYYDLPKLDDDGYIPRYITSNSSRDRWSKVPEAAMNDRPLVIYRNDVLVVDGHIGRYSTIDISNGSISAHSLTVKNDAGKPVAATGFPGLSRWKDACILIEDCLGKCYEDMTVIDDCIRTNN